MELRVLSLYPEQMNIYADRGNILFLQRRCEWRGIGFLHAGAGPGEPVDPAAYDLFYIGGGQDRDQRAVAADMVSTKQRELTAAADEGAVLLAVCGGYQLLGHRYRGHQGDDIPGTGLVDLETVAGDTRLIGNVLVDCGGGRTMVGFENHAGRTWLGGGVQPLGRVVAGAGNNGEDRTEGCRAERIVGTYVHGPLLPKNPWIADELIGHALARRDGGPLTPLDDALELRTAEGAATIARAERR